MRSATSDIARRATTPIADADGSHPIRESHRNRGKRWREPSSVGRPTS
jgi:hypothetical protein